MEADRVAPAGRALVVCVSWSHRNTWRVAQAIARELDADVVDPDDIDAGALDGCDLLGLGSGIYFMSVHPRLVDLVDRLPPGRGRCAFTFSTSGTVPVPWFGTSGLRDRLRDRDWRVVGDFNCRGLDTVGPLGWFGGINRGRPSAEDLERAARFARGVRDRSAAAPP